MIRGPRRVCTAVRRSDGSISVDTREYLALAARYPVLGWPLIRGMVALFESLALGIGALGFSAEEAAAAEGEEISPGEMALTTAVAMVFAVGLFILAPTALGNLMQRWVSHGTALNLLEGLIRLVILLVYIWSISRLPDMGRVLQYHGAEHKVIHALEAGDELRVERVKHYSILHPRCGTSFLLLVALVSIVLFSFFGWPGVWQRLLVRLAMLPVVAGTAYELIRASARSSSPLWAPLTAPGLWLQKLTTREPEDGQIEVAIRALTGTLEAGDLKRKA